jgi:hypothetical protein
MPTKRKSEPKAAAPNASAPKAAAPDAEASPAPLNREQRRAQKFGRAGKVHQHDAAIPWPENAANPALTSATEDQAARTDGADAAGTTRSAAPKTAKTAKAAKG